LANSNRPVPRLFLRVRQGVEDHFLRVRRRIQVGEDLRLVAARGDLEQVDDVLAIALIGNRFCRDLLVGGGENVQVALVVARDASQVRQGAVDFQVARLTPIRPAEGRDYHFAVAAEPGHVETVVRVDVGQDARPPVRGSSVDRRGAGLAGVRPSLEDDF